MTGYLINFSIYTMAMLGIIFAALFVFKKFSNGCFTKKSSNLNIEETLNLSARKTLHVINVKGEKFLIAADIDRTSLIAKLDEDKKEVATPREDKSKMFSNFDGIESLDEFASVIDFNQKKAKKEPVMRELARKLSKL